jgi:osmoprotectant transport system permease protein
MIVRAPSLELAKGSAVVAQTDEPIIRWKWIGDHTAEIKTALVQHLELTLIAVGVGFVLSMALALVILRFRITFAPINAITGVLYAIPSLALFVLLVPITGLTTLTAEIALVSYTLQIIVRSIVAGVDGVSPAVRDAATGMGYTRGQQLWRVEMPLALPVIMSGVRIATVTTVGLVPIAGLLGSDQGGLGQLIFDGLNRFFNTPLLVGALFTVLLAVVLDVALVQLEHVLTPWARKTRKRKAAAA